MHALAISLADEGTGRDHQGSCSQNNGDHFFILSIQQVGSDKGQKSDTREWQFKQKVTCPHDNVYENLPQSS